MNVILKPGDTFASLAARYTNVPDMAEAIAEHNGVYADDGITPFHRHAPLPVSVLGTVEIPDEWLTGRVDDVLPTFNSEQIFNLPIVGAVSAKVVYGALGLIAVALILSTGKHH